MFDCSRLEKLPPSIGSATAAAGPCPGKPILFIDVMAAVDSASGLTRGVQNNMRSAVAKIAQLMSAQGLHGEVVISAIDEKLADQTAATLNMKTANGLAGVKSNFRRALRAAGLQVMPGRHVTPLSPAWRALMASFGDNRLSIKLSRFAHVASEHGWEPQEIGPSHLDQFRVLLTTTNIGSKTDRVVRDTATAWAFGVQNLPGWPSVTLGRSLGKDWFYGVPWSEFPASFQVDVELFVTRKGCSFDDDLNKIEFAEDDDLLAELPQTKRRRKPLHERTKNNYRDAFRRMASILVKLGRPASDICCLADLVALPDVTRVLRFMRERTKKSDGGHIAYFAFLLYFVASEHVKLPWKQIADLEELWRRVRGEHGSMSPRSFRRLQQFDDAGRSARMADLPNTLAAAARSHKAVDNVSIRLMRTAVFTAIGLETGMRNGNIVGLTLDHHVTLRPVKKKWAGEIVVPGAEVKNKVEIFSKISSETAALIREWIDVFRPVVLKTKNAQSSCLFPNESGGHIAVALSTQSFKDLGAKYAGLDITPHVMRSYVGNLMLAENPDSYPQVQQFLGHRNLKTTLAYYAPVRPMQVRQRVQRLLAEKQAERR